MWQITGTDFAGGRGGHRNCVGRHCRMLRSGCRCPGDYGDPQQVQHQRHTQHGAAPMETNPAEV